MSRLKRYDLPNQCYLVTTVTRDRRPYFADARLATMLVDNLRFYRERMGFLLHGYVIMPDHVHLLVTPVACTVSEIMRNFKSFTSKQIRETLRQSGPIWQRRFYDRVIRDEQQFLAALDYIHLNPVRSGLVSSPENYEFSSCRAFAECGTPLLHIDSLEGSRLGP